MGQQKIISSIPNTSQWQPRKNVTETLKSAFLKRCIAAENFIRLKSQHEKAMNLDNFDSGVAVEEIIREELKHLLPTRYSVKAGVINDRKGNTGGDFDVVIFNDLWFPIIKSGATEKSRRIHIPIDGVYAICEIKQTLDFAALDKAMEKLVVCQRLYRPKTCVQRIVENREGNSCIHGLSNPLYSAIIVTDLRKGVNFEELIPRFFEINKTLKRLEVVRALCVLNHGTVTWGFKDSSGESKPAMFMLEDLYCQIFPVFHKMPDVKSALYRLMVDLLSHLYHSVLAAEDIAPSYGPEEHLIRTPASSDITLEPDPEWISMLDTVCHTEHNLKKGNLFK